MKKVPCILIPLELVIAPQSGAVMVGCESLCLYASGSDVPDAMEDFIKQFKYFCKFYKRKNMEDLSDEAAKVKKIYETQRFK